MDRQLQDSEIRRHLFEDDGRIPNNSDLPLLLYPGALSASDDLPSECEALFRENGWGGAWRNGIFPYHHYHPTAHEVLGIVRGTARLAFGGESGATVEVEAGGGAVVPPGGGDCKPGAHDDFLGG